MGDTTMVASPRMTIHVKLGDGIQVVGSASMTGWQSKRVCATYRLFLATLREAGGYVLADKAPHEVDVSIDLEGDRPVQMTLSFEADNAVVAANVVKDFRHHWAESAKK